MFYPMYLQIELNKYNTRFDCNIMKVLSSIIAKSKNLDFQEQMYNSLYGLYKFIKRFDSFFKFPNNELCRKAKEEFNTKYLSSVWFMTSAIYHHLEDGDFASIYANEYWKITQANILKLWKSIDFSSESGALEGKFMGIFEDLINSTVKQMPTFTEKKLSDFTNLYRASTYCPYDSYKYIMPDPEYCKDNRWNDDGVAYLYLSYDNHDKKNGNILVSQRTCFEEKRLTKDTTVAVCQFKPVNSDIRILDLTYKGLDLNQLTYELQELPVYIVKEILDILKSSSKFNKRARKYAVSGISKADFNRVLYKYGFNEISQTYVLQRFSYLVLDNICEAVFYAVDKKDDPELEAYIPFRKFSKYLISKGYGGVAYKSTRMELVGLEGYCLTLFEPNDAEPVRGTMQVYEYNGWDSTLLKCY